MSGQPISSVGDSKASFCFGLFRLEPGSGLLLCDTQPVPLTPKAFQALLYLVQHSGQLVTKDELMSALWPDSFVTESNLTQTIFMVRKALGDTGSEHRYLTTVPARGFRFVAAVKRIEDTTSLISTSATGKTRKVKTGVKNRLIATATVGALLLLASVGLWLKGTRKKDAAAAPPIRSLAVLPLRNLSPTAEEGYFADGMTDELITRVSAIEGLSVISRTSVMHYKESMKSLREIAAELGVDAVVEGTIFRAGDRVRITAQLVRASDDRHLWANSYERDVRDVLALQDDIARDIALNISRRLNASAEKHLVHRSAISPDALEWYLRGRYHWRTRKINNLRAAISEFQQALSMEPDFALAYAGLADCYAVLPLLAKDPASELYPKAKQAAEKALLLDPTLAEVHASAAFVKMYQDWDFAGAEHEFQEALRLDPNYSTAHQWYAALLVLERRQNEARLEIRKAEELDPVSAIVYLEAGQIYRQMRQYDRALAEYKRSLEIDPRLAVNDWWMAYTYLHLEKPHEAAQAMRDAYAQVSDERRATASKLAADIEQRPDDLKRQAGDLMEFRRMAARPSYFLAIGYASMGEDDKAFRYLDAAYEAHDPEVLSINVDPEWDRLRSNPRFAALSKKVGLPRPTNE